MEGPGAAEGLRQDAHDLLLPPPPPPPFDEGPIAAAQDAASHAPADPVPAPTGALDLAKVMHGCMHACTLAGMHAAHCARRRRNRGCSGYSWNNDAGAG